MMQNGVQYASTRLSDLINMMKKNKLLTCGHECCYKVPYDLNAVTCIYANMKPKDFKFLF